MRVPKKSTGTYKKRPFFPLNLHSLPNLPSLLSPPTCLTCPTSLTCPTIASAARTPTCSSSPTCLTCPTSLTSPTIASAARTPTSLTSPTIASAARTPTSLTSPTIASAARTPNPPSLFNSFRKISSIASLYFRYRKDTGSPKDYRKMSEAQTSNCRLKTRKISYSNPIHNLFQISYYSQPS